MREGVAAFAVEITDELPRALTTFERRLLRETLLETAHELSGAALERLAAQLRRARLHRRGRARAALAPGAAPRARRGDHRRARRPRQRARAAQGPARSRAARALRVRARAHARRRGRPARRGPRRAVRGRDRFGQGATGRGAARLRPGLGHRAAHAARRPAPPAAAPADRRRARRAARVRRRARADRRAATIADDELCARACHALGKIGDPESAEPLAAVAMDGARPWFVRTAAAGACGQIGDPRTADTLVDALDSEEWYPRNAAASALVRLEDAGVAAVCSRVSLARARVGRALLGPARRRRPHGGDHRPRRRAASAGCAASSPRPRAPARPPGSRSWPAQESAIGPLRGARARQPPALDPGPGLHGRRPRSPLRWAVAA